MEFDYKRFGQFVVYKRKFSNTSQKNLAEKMGVSQSHVSRIEKGIACPSLDFICKFGSIFEGTRSIIQSFFID